MNPYYKPSYYGFEMIEFITFNGISYQESLCFWKSEDPEEGKLFFATDTYEISDPESEYFPPDRAFDWLDSGNNRDVLYNNPVFHACTIAEAVTILKRAHNKLGPEKQKEQLVELACFLIP